MNKKNILITMTLIVVVGLFYDEVKSLMASILSPVLVNKDKGVGKLIITVTLGLLVFLYAYKNSVKLFQWIEDQTYGTRDYILKKCDLLFIEVKPDHITYALLFLTFGTSTLTIGFFSLLGYFKVGLVFGAIAAIIGWKIPRPIINLMVDLRIKKIETQFVDALNLLSNGLRAGRGLQQSMSMVVEELPPPVSQEFNKILQETKIGVSINDAFDNFAKRVPTDDNNMFVSSINILKETGGNLAEVFDTIIDIIRERMRLKQKIASFVSQGRAQASVMFCMPFVMAMFFGSSDPQFFTKMATPIGIVFIVAALVMDCLGAYIIMKIINIKV